MKLSKILNNINYDGKLKEREITYITHDSRKVKEGTLFIALKGNKSDGHDYIFDAIDKGAIAVLANGRAPATDIVPILQVKNPRKIMSKVAYNFFDSAKLKLNIIGITGTNGKTTTTQIINHILNKNQLNSASLGTLGFDTPSGMQSTNFTTPESIDLHHILKVMKNGGINHVPMEVSSHAIEMNRVDNVTFNIGVFTNLGLDHLDFHETKENYFKSKLKLFKRLNKNSTSIVNIDDPYCERILDSIKCKALSYGFNNKATIYIKKYSLGLENTSATISYKNVNYSLKTPLIGKFNLYNLLAGIICSVKIGITIKKAIESAATFKYIPGRFEKFKLPNNKGYAIVDYAHSPDAYENIFTNILQINKKRDLITVFGCGGERDDSKRPLMGSIAEKYSKQIFITNDNPRNENPDKIISDIKSGLKTKNHTIIKNRKEAILKALNMATNHIVLLLGKGIEEHQIIKNEQIYHSDINIVKEFINEN